MEKSPGGSVKVPPPEPKLPVNQRLRSPPPRSRITPPEAEVIFSSPATVQPAPMPLPDSLSTVSVPVTVVVVVVPRMSPMASE